VIIKNRDQLATTELRRKTLDIIQAGIERALPGRIMQSALSFDRCTRSISINHDVYDLSGRLFVIGGGKASCLMAQMLEKIIGTEVITDGLVIDKACPPEFTSKCIRMDQAGHPLPDLRGVAAMNDLLRLKPKYSIGERDLVLCLLSGGGSALMPSPVEGISLNDKQEVTRLLLSCGANIWEINSVRKHLSKTKGGRLAQYFAPARVVSVILSDVIDNDLSVIASGPTCPDPSTFAEAYAALEKYNLLEKIPAGVRLILEQGCRGERAETPKSLDNVHNYVIGDVRMVLEAMAEKAVFMGFNPLIISSAQTGDTENTARQRAHEILAGRYPGYDALFIGGETTPTLPDNPGLGGRNQHYAAVSLSAMSSYRGEWVMAAIGTDGTDYLANAAGAMVDNHSLEEAHSQAIDIKRYIDRYDSNRLLKEIGHSIVITG
jgi:glycerate 2-kinase